MQRDRRRALCVCVGAALSFWLWAAVHAFVLTQWTGMIGNWDTATNWDTGNEPTGADITTIGNGGTVEITTAGNQANAVQVGDGGGTSGTLRVTGDGRLSAGISLGNGGTAVMVVQGGGQVTHNGSNITIGGSGNGTLTIDGLGSRVDFTGRQLNLGIFGSGILRIINSGEFVTGNVVIGDFPDGGTRTIDIGNGGAAGVLTATSFSIQVAATLNFNHSNDITFATGIPGPMLLTKAGTGNLTLSGANTYTGGTTISGGTLTGTTASLPGNITNNGMLVFSQAAAGTFAGVISGTGAFSKTGIGDLTLSGANTYTGATTVGGGVLQAGAANVLGVGSAVTVSAGTHLNSFSQTIGSLAGAGFVTLGAATLTAGGNGTSTTHSGVISGAGALTKTGAGVMTLTNANTYSGGTTVSAGTLAGSTTSLQGNIANSAAVVFNQAINGTYAGVISGTGSLTKSGTGIVTLSGNNTYSGTTTVSAGTLLVNGTQGASAVSLTGGVLGGSGTVGAVTATGGTVAPGISPAILNSGSVAFNAATTFSAELNGLAPGPGGYDQLNVTGTVALGNATLTLLPGFVAPLGTTFTVINNDLGDAVTGTFGGLAQGAIVSAAGQTFRISYVGGSGNDVVLTAVSAVSVSPGTLPAMTVGEPFTVTFTATGGVAPYTFSVSAGPLPDGLSLVAATGVLSGTPTTAGPYTFTITATDSIGGTDVQAYTGDVVAPVPSLPLWGFLALAGLVGFIAINRLRGAAG